MQPNQPTHAEAQARTKADLPPYSPARRSTSVIAQVRGLRYHIRSWGSPEAVSPGRPPLVMLHGWMDVAASFQFVVDALQTERYVLAPDWRGFGLTQSPGLDTYWFPDYLADLDALLDQLLPGQTIDLLGHSMGGNVAMFYAGVRSQRVRRLINLEGFGLPDSHPEQAPKRYAKWLDELKQPVELRSYDSLQAVADRLCKTNPLLRRDRADWLAPHWAQQAHDGRWEILGDPVHKRINPVLYRREEALACWQQISAPVLWAEGDQTDLKKFWGDRYPRADFEARLATVKQLERHVLSPAGHMLHHDQPEALARHIEAFLERR
ncbi:alpha/beta hydrolase [Aquabacterium sp. A7-Y]|uniref:alpha/beta fold hydrolase n=1 Tax=Aquabacterium sp. A7-Y TaxID=1349605 RepID=UPI00223D1CEA|nr:alpha/beta hydrolase [Aquabacterium sp. A7-Y]MCW7536285.1 alpha/beta hydrolase [Aquabacterium sp. A7-Y]